MDRMMMVFMFVGVLNALFLSTDAAYRVHAALVDPAARTSFSVTDMKNSLIDRTYKQLPRDYNNDRLTCGGRKRQWNPVNHGRCGVCGDAYSAKRPQAHEIGGKFVGTLVYIAKTYVQGQIMSTAVKLINGQAGYFEFRLCDRGSGWIKLTNTCLNQRILKRPSSGTIRYPMDAKTGYVIHAVQLPADLSCDFCVLQWKYVITGNLLPRHSDHYETIVGCADIRINSTDTPLSESEGIEGSGSYEVY